MKKIKYILGFIFLETTPALAQVDQPANPGGLPQNLLGAGGLITKISNAILALVGVTAVLFIIIGGFLYITSAGNPEQTDKAKKTLLYAIIGLVAVIISWAAVKFIMGAIK